MAQIGVLVDSKLGQLPTAGSTIELGKIAEFGRPVGTAPGGFPISGIFRLIGGRVRNLFTLA